MSTHIGFDFTPPDVPGKVTGEINYAEDYKSEGMVFARLLTSPLPSGRVVGIDAREALRMDGVLGIFTADDEGSCTWVSREFSQLTGVEHEAARGTGWLAGVADEHRMRVHDEWTMFVGSRGAIEFDSLFSTATGEEVRGRAVPVEADCGWDTETISGYFGQFRPLRDMRATDPITGAS